MEAPLEGEWNRPAQEFYFTDFKAAGLQAVRLPLRWDQHTLKEAPYTVNATWMERVQIVVGYALVNGLKVVINSYDDSWLDNATAFEAQLPRFTAIWQQVGAALASAPSELVLFEAFNEPNHMTTAQLNQMLAAFYGAVRPTNPDRTLILGWLGAMNPGWAFGNNRSDWDAMAIPGNGSDPHLAVEVHSYDPFASCGEGKAAWDPVADAARMDHMFGNMSQWSADHGGIPVVFGEFGCIASCPQRVQWMQAFAQRCGATPGIAGCLVWDDNGGYRLYNRTARTFNDTLLQALGLPPFVPPPPVPAAPLPSAADDQPYVLPLAPTPLANGYLNASLWSWGGSVIEAPPGSASPWRYHMYAAAFVNGCGLAAWESNSEVIHAVSNDPLGPFRLLSTVLPVFHHNPQATVAPDGTVLLFSIGMDPQGRVANCSTGRGTDAAPHHAPRPMLQHGPETVELWYASSLDGPFTPLPNPTGGYNGLNQFNGTNPAPAWDPSGNGTLYVASHSGDNMTVAVAHSWRGPYSAPVPVFPLVDATGYQAEDPFLWFDAAAGVWRMLYHMYNRSQPHLQFRVGGAAHSADADIFSPWTVQPNAVPAYTTVVNYTDGSSTVLQRRERPKLLFNATTGQPAVLYNGVCPADSRNNCYTLAVPLLQTYM